MCKTAAGEQNISVIPKPVSVEPGKGFFILKPGFVIAADGESSRVGGYLAAFFSPALGTEPIVAAYNKKKKYTGAIILKIDKNKMKLGDEGYELNVRPDNITVTAESQAGLFHGVQTLRQLLPPQIESREKVTGVEWKVPCVKITDYPRFQWRGLMLDTGRHFFPKDFVLKYIDLMSMYKLNRLHLHLTEDQGWRLEIKKYPELTKIGAWRGKSKTADLFMNPSGKAHGGFYTQDDMREIIAYAAERFVTIVPEIEMPGHSQAALASVPGLSCRDQKFKVLTHWGVNQEVYCAGNEKVFEFLQDVLTEVAELFPGGYIHIGGDEVPKDRWKECPKCQARIKAEGLKDESELQSYFVKRIERFINSKGKRLIGWDEILEGGLPPRATVMSWRGMDGGIAAAQSGHDVIMSPTSNCYLDYAQSPADEPGAIGGPDGPKLPLCKVYSFEPAPDALTPDQAKHILGAQANLWTEYVEETKHAEYMAYPRAEAIAELTWTPKELKNWDDFLSRVITDDARLDIIGVNYRPPRENETTLCEQKP
jgi:hexosaminidase